MSIERDSGGAQQRHLPEACSARDSYGRVDPQKERQYNDEVAQAVGDPAEAEEYQIGSRGMSSFKFATCLGCTGTYGDGFELPAECHALRQAPQVPDPRRPSP